jgi:hypothetical protein
MAKKQKRLNVDSREDWLNAAVSALRPLFAEQDMELAEKIRVSCGFPGGGSRVTRIGECWTSAASKDGTFEIFISPILDDGARVLDILVHELCHVAAGLDAGHRGEFVRAAKAMRLQGPWKSTTAGPDFAREISEPVLAAIGAEYPHAALRAANMLSTGPKKQTTRLLKCVCGECGYTVRTTARWIDDVGEPICPCNREPMELQQ